VEVIATKDAIEEIFIEVTSDGLPALSMMVHRDGSLGRQGSGAIPQTQPVILGMTDGRYFRGLIELVDDVVLQHAGGYDYLDKAGAHVEYTLVFFGAGPVGSHDRPRTGFRLSLGTDTTDVHPIVKYVDTFITRAVAATNPWYEAALAGKHGADCPGGV
jgi:hypothetical protein